jgi:isopentenyl diphosphate isomerase/L-lactate dehydrogenase-like FMN-dependent dehydrogenase
MVAEFETIQEIVLRAYQQMSPHVREHMNGGSESETTLLRNRHSIDSLAFRPRVLRDVSEIDPSTTFIGSKLRIPVFLAPVGSLDQVCPEAPLLATKAAAEFGTLMFLSSVSSFPPLEPERAAEEAGDRLVFQLYQRGDWAWLDAYLERVVEIGCRAFCLTVDTSYYSRRERDLFNRYAPPGREGGGGRTGFLYQATITWELVDRIRDRIEIPLIVKGVVTAEDARLAVEHGVEVVYVSNHGGRQLDHGLGAMEVLPEVVEAVAGKAEVVVDSGFVRGSDILKAIALGARAVGLGKLQALALAAGGDAGVKRMLEILETEISINMGLLGVTKLDQLDASYLQKATPVKYPTDLSPFPSIEALFPADPLEQ